MELFYYRARYYDPTIGRFLQEDPIGLLGGPNFYVYAGNDPITNVDPFGLCTGDLRKCMTKFLRDNYNDFVADTLVPNFSLGSLLTDTADYVKSATEALAVKGGIVVGIGGAGAYMISRGYRIIWEPAANYGQIFGLSARANASASSIATGKALQYAAKIGANTLTTIGVGIASFATTAQVLAYWHCRDQAW
jgi:uncharacterized protein RhaS with RHS repeats